MNKTITTIVLSVLLLIFIPVQRLNAEPTVIKWGGDVKGPTCNMILTGNINVGYDDNNNTISISFEEAAKDLEILIYDEKGNLVSRDIDNGQKGQSINYTLVDAEPGIYTLYIKTKDNKQIIGTFEVK